MMEQFAVSISGIESFRQIEMFLNRVSLERRKVIENYVFEKDKIRSLTAEILLRHILHERYGIPQTKIAFTYNQYGKPFLKSPNRDICFNLSHSGDLVVCGVGRTNVGIDVERKKNGIWHL